MDEETRYLIKMTAAFLHGEKMTMAENINYPLLCMKAKAHNLISIAFSVFNTAENASAVPEKCRLSASEYFFSSIYLYESQKKAVENIYNILNRAEIRHVLFKGAIIKEYYPVPECRLMGDIDILIDEKNRNAAKKALVSNGYACTAQNGPVYDYRKGDILLEVHTHMVNGNKRLSDAFADAMEHAQFEGCCGKPDDSYHFAYLIAHLAHHFLFYGAGIKLILDLAVMLLKCDIDLDFVLKKCEEAGIAKFAKIVLSVCYKWYHVGKCFVEDTEECEEFLTSYGAFGNLNRNNGAVAARRQMESGKKANPISSKISLAFPSYDQMKEIPYIRFLDGRPWLVPYAWGYRIVYNVRHRKNLMKNTARGLNSEETYNIARDELAFFKEIGLL